MTEELLAAIDAFLAEIASLNFVPSSQVTDFALDLRLLVSREEVPA